MIQQALRHANELGFVSDAVVTTAAMMVSYIKDDFDHPVCTVEVMRMARDRGRDERTIRRHIRALVDAGLAEDRTAGNGLRGVFSGGAVVFGVSFEPAVNALGYLREAVEQKRAEEGRIVKLRRGASYLRRRLRAACEEINDLGLLEWLATLPRRYDALSPDELAHLVAECERQLEALIAAQQKAQTKQDSASGRLDQAVDEDSFGRPKMSGGPDKNDRPYTNKKFNNNLCTRRAMDVPLLRTAGTVDNDEDNTLTIDKVMPALSDEWREMLQAHYQNGISIERAFACVAEQIFQVSGGSARAWQIAQDRIRHPILLACLVLIAEKTPPRSPDRWLMAMAKRAEARRVNWSSPLRGLARMRLREFVPC